MRSCVYLWDQADIQRDPLTEYDNRYAQDTPRSHMKRNTKYHAPCINLFSEQERDTQQDSTAYKKNNEGSLLNRARTLLHMMNNRLLSQTR